MNFYTNKGRMIQIRRRKKELKDAVQIKNNFNVIELKYANILEKLSDESASKNRS